jgi:hypothetical protein
MVLWNPLHVDLAHGHQEVHCQNDGGEDEPEQACQCQVLAESVPRQTELIQTGLAERMKQQWNRRYLEGIGEKNKPEVHTVAHQAGGLITGAPGDLKIRTVKAPKEIGGF